MTSPLLHQSSAVLRLIGTQPLLQHEEHLSNITTAAVIIILILLLTVSDIYIIIKLSEVNVLFLTCRNML